MCWIATGRENGKRQKPVDNNCRQLLLAEDAERWTLYVVVIYLKNGKYPDHRKHEKNVKHNNNDSEPSI